jgi:Tfp pilus assembly protein PilV
MEPNHQGVSVKKLNSSGFGLIEVMIAAGILCVIAIGFSQVVMNGMKGQGAVSANSDASNVASLVQLINQNLQACSNNFRPALGIGFSNAGIVNGATYTPGNPHPALTSITFNDGVNTPIVTSGGMFGAEFKVTKLELQVLAREVAGLSYLANIHIELTKQGASIAGSSVLVKDVPISLLSSWNPPPAGPNVLVQGCAIPGGRTQCPANFTLIGTPGTLETFCISMAPQPVNTWQGAFSACRSTATGSNGTARLCSQDEWLTACQSGGVVGMGAQQEWVGSFIYNGANMINSVALGAPAFGCGNMGAPVNGFLADYPTTSYSSRCCFR